MLSLALSPVALADPISDLAKDGDACFRRDYDMAHLRNNPRQQTTPMTVWITAGKDMRSGSTGLALEPGPEITIR